MVNIPFFLEKNRIIDITFDEGLDLKVLGIRIPATLIKFVKRHRRLAVLANKLLGKTRRDYLHERVIPYDKAKAIMPDAGIIYCAPGYEDIVLNALRSIPGIEEVIRGSELYWGENIDKAPDFVLIPRYDYCISVGKNAPFTKRNTAHHCDGIMISWGEDVEEFMWKDTFRPWDVGTYIIALAGMPLPHDADGFTPSKSHKKFNYLLKWNLARRVRRVRNLMA